MAKELTTAERRALKAIRRIAKKLKHVNPTHGRIAKELGVSQWGATKVIHRLVAKQRAVNPPDRRRSLELTELGWHEDLDKESA